MPEQEMGRVRKKLGNRQNSENSITERKSMKPGDKVELTESISILIRPSTDLGLDTGLPGVVVSTVNVYGFCRVQINICEKFHISTTLHKSQIKRSKSR